jgi:hypothetical protein
MTDPRAVTTLGKGFLIASGIACVALAIYFQDFSFVLYWLYFIVIFAIACAAIFLIWSVTIWPLVLLIGRLFQRSRD